jgi:hypothetical protein
VVLPQEVINKYLALVAGRATNHIFVHLTYFYSRLTGDTHAEYDYSGAQQSRRLVGQNISA